MDLQGVPMYQIETDACKNKLKHFLSHQYGTIKY